MAVLQRQNRSTDGCSILKDATSLGENGLKIRTNLIQEQDKSSDIEQQPPFSDRKYRNTLPQKRGGGTKPMETS